MKNIVNHDMMNYDFKEGTAFDGLMPKIAKKIGVCGGSEVSVPLYDMNANGVDALEVVNINKVWDSAVVEPDFTQPNVVLGADYTPEKPIIISGVDTTVKLNGKKVTAPLFTESNAEIVEGATDSCGFWVKDGSLTIEGEGEVVAQEATYSMAVWANGGNVTIKGGKFFNGGDSCDLIYASNGGNVVIEGGEFFPIGPASGNAPGTKNPYSGLNVKDADYKSGKSSIVVKGGIFHNFNPGDNLSEGPATNYVAEGYESVEVEPNVWKVVKK